MFSLTEIFQNAQGGQASQNLANQFGLSKEQVDQAVAGIIPAISAAFLSKLKDPSALGGLAASLNDGTHTSTFSNPTAAGSPETTAKGNDILSQLFGSSHILTQIAQQVASVTGLRAEVILQLAPAIVSIIAGGLATSLKSQGLGGILGQLISGVSASAPASSSADQGGGGLIGILGKIFGSLLGGGGPAPATTTKPASSGLDSLTKILQPGSGSVGIEDEIGKILGSSRR